MKLSGVSKTKSKQIGKFGFWLCLIWGLIVWAPAFACAQEIPEFELPADAPTSAEFRERGLQFYLKELELYQEKTQDSPEVKKVVAPFIRASLELIANAERDEQPKVREKVTQLAVHAMASGSEDPIFLIHASLSCQHKKEYAQAIGLADRAIEQFDKLDSYPRAMRSVLIWRFVSMELGNGQFVNHWRGKVDPWRDEVYKELPEFLVYGASLPEGHRHTFAFLNKIINAVGTNDQDAAKQLKLIGDVVDEYSKHEDKDDWLLEMANGAFLRKMAWKLRGSGFAGTVKPRGWAKFGELMPKASQHFRAAYELHPEYPEAAAKLIGVAMAGHDDESTWHWFEKAIAAEVDHTPAYDSMSWALRPRWGGSHDAMIEFGKRCNASGRYDTLVPMELPFKLINIKSEGVSWKEIFKRPGLFDEVMDCCEKLLEDPSRANPDGALRGEWTRVLTNQICLATVADKHEKALELWKKLGDHEPPSYVTRYYNVSPEYSRSRSHAYIEFGDELREMRALAAPPRTNLEGKRKLLAGFEDLVQSSADPGHTIKTMTRC